MRRPDSASPSSTAPRARRGSAARPAVRQLQAAVAFSGSQYLALWSGRYPGATSNLNVFAARFDCQGNVIDTAPVRVMSSTGNVSYNVKVATDGTGFFAVWQQSGTIEGERGSDSSGRAPDDPPLSIRPADVTMSQSSPGVAFDGTNYLVTWGETNYSIRGARVGRDGTLLDTTAVVLVGAGTLLPDPPAVAFDGTNFLLAYHRDAYDARLQATATLLLQSFTPALALGPGGAVANVCMNCSSVTTAPTVAAGRGHGLMAFVRPDESMGYELHRVRMLMLTETPVVGTPCLSSAACEAGRFCVDGVCCETECAGGTRDCQACSVSAGAARSGTCGPVVAGQSCMAGTAAGVCTAASACMALPPDAGADGTVAGDAGRDGGTDLPGADAATDGGPVSDANVGGDGVLADARDATAAGDAGLDAAGGDAASGSDGPAATDAGTDCPGTETDGARATAATRAPSRSPPRAAGARPPAPARVAAAPWRRSPWPWSSPPAAPAGATDFRRCRDPARGRRRS